jgi:hypothetical protein
LDSGGVDPDIGQRCHHFHSSRAGRLDTEQQMDSGTHGPPESQPGDHIDRQVGADVHAGERHDERACPGQDSSPALDAGGAPSRSPHQHRAWRDPDAPRNRVVLYWR